jgi:secondary thiamine-phosphate synthase enzyme
MQWVQRQIALSPRPRGFHLVTAEIERLVPEIKGFQVGFAHFFVQHTSASLSINENADPTVRADMASHFDQAVPEGAAYFRHTDEGPDDMPAHVKSAILGSGILVPISKGRLAFGTWQGIYLGEHRDRAAGRRLIVTLFGEAS